MGAIFFQTIMHDEIAQLDGWAGSQKVDNFQENQRGIDALPAKAKWKFFSIPSLAAAQNGVTKFLEFLVATDKNRYCFLPASQFPKSKSGKSGGRKGKRLESFCEREIHNLKLLLKCCYYQLVIIWSFEMSFEMSFEEFCLKTSIDYTQGLLKCLLHKLWAQNQVHLVAGLVSTIPVVRLFTTINATTSKGLGKFYKNVWIL